MTYFFTAAIGPVQDFIATARRTRDLWFGSRLLSELSKAAARAILEADPANELIFPSVTKENRSALDADSDFDVANKVVALIQGDPTALGDRVREAIELRLTDIAEAAFKHITEESFHRKKSLQQIMDAIELYWAAVPLAAEYAQARADAERLLAARKVTRDFAPVAWGDSVPKSSLDGQRESVIDEKVYNVYRERPQTLRRKYGVRPGERLCGVGMLKRHGILGGNDRFFSTSHVAALPFLSGLANMDSSHHRDAAERYFQALEELGLSDGELGNVPGDDNPVFKNHDGHLLFEERLSDFFDREAEIDKKSRKVERAKEKLRQFLKETTLVHSRPAPYYALLHADGDRMGKALDRETTKDGHQRISTALVDFARQVREIVANHSGSLVYAGGDDVLAFLPLHTILPCARELARAFKSRLEGFKSDQGSPTLSVGVAVTHHLDPLSDALELARKAEKIAKNKGGRNALAVIVAKRSGSETTVYGKWGEIDPRLRDFTELHRTDAFPDGAAYELRDVHRRLSGHSDSAPDKTLTAEILRAETKRILKRKRAASGAVEVAAETVRRITGYLDEGLSLDRLADEIIVARLFADAENLAEGRKK